MQCFAKPYVIVRVVFMATSKIYEDSACAQKPAAAKGKAKAAPSPTKARTLSSDSVSV